MSFLAVLLALLIEQVRPLPHNNWSADALRGWSGWTRERFDAGHPVHAWIVLAVTLLIPAAAVLFLYRTVSSLGGVPAALVFDVSVLYLTLGFRHFSHYFTDIRKALERGDEIAARRELGEWLRMEAADLPRSELLRHVLEHSLLAAHRHVFGVFFWYIVGAVLGWGPAGAIVYRMAEYLERRWRTRPAEDPDAASDALSRAADGFFALLDFVPARLTAFGFAVVGDFESAIEGWRRWSDLWARRNDGVILASAAGAVGVRLGRAESAAAPQADPYGSLDTEAAALEGAREARGQTPGGTPELAHLHSVVGLVWRSMLLWMALLVIITLANFFG